MSDRFLAWANGTGKTTVHIAISRGNAHELIRRLNDQLANHDITGRRIDLQFPAEIIDQTQWENLF